MPSVTVHLRLAETVVQRWSGSDGPRPFDPAHPEHRNAFYQGAVGPDLGYVPGGYRPLSDLAHCLRPGDLTRQLIRRAESPTESAFAWGWVTHVLADTMIHPLVGCAVGELVTGTPSRFLDGDTEPHAHVAIEAGLDAIYAERNPQLRRLRLRPAFDSETIEYLVDGFRGTYGAAPPAHLFLRSHWTAARRATQALALAAWTSRTFTNRTPTLRTGAEHRRGWLSRVRAHLRRRSTTFAYVLPVLPPVWFLNAVRDVEENFAELFFEELAANGASLANVNLDTGRPDDTEGDYGGYQRSVAFVRDLGGSLVSQTDQDDLAPVHEAA